MPKNGTTSSTCSVLVRKPSPMKTPTSIIHLADPFSIERIVAQAPSAINSTSSASGLLKRNISTATGVSAITAPDSRPAAAPK